MVLPDGTFFVAVCFVPYHVGARFGLIRTRRCDVNFGELVATYNPLSVDTWKPIAVSTADSM